MSTESLMMIKHRVCISIQTKNSTLLGLIGYRGCTNTTSGPADTASHALESDPFTHASKHEEILHY